MVIAGLLHSTQELLELDEVRGSTLAGAFISQCMTSGAGCTGTSGLDSWPVRPKSCHASSGAKRAGVLHQPPQMTAKSTGSQRQDALPLRADAPPTSFLLKNPTSTSSARRLPR